MCNLLDLRLTIYDLMFFSEIKDVLLLAEVIKKSNSSDYRSATMFGEGIFYLFEFVNGKLEKNRYLISGKTPEVYGQRTSHQKRQKAKASMR